MGTPMDQAIRRGAPRLDVGGAVHRGPAAALVEIVGGVDRMGPRGRGERRDTGRIGVPGVDPQGNAMSDTFDGM